MPRQKSIRSFVFKMKCEVTSNITHDVLTSNDVSYKTYKEICSGEPKKVNLGFNNDFYWKVENNTLMPYPKSCVDTNNCVHNDDAKMCKGWEILFKFHSIHNIEPNWLDCNYTWGWYDEDLKGFTGCVGKV